MRQPGGGGRSGSVGLAENRGADFLEMDPYGGHDLPVPLRGRLDSEGPQHAVTVRAFALGKYDVTSEEFLIFLRETGYEPAQCDPRYGLGWSSPST